MAEPTYKAGIVGLDVIAGHRPGVRRRARGTHLGIAQWPTGRLGGVGTHMFDAMVTGRPVDAVSGWLDEAGKTGCRGDACRDPGGWGMLRLEGGLIVSVDAADYARVPPRIRINGTEGRGHAIGLEYWDGEAGARGRRLHSGERYGSRRARNRRLARRRHAVSVRRWRSRAHRGGDSPSTSLIAATLPGSSCRLRAQTAISSFTAADGCSPNSNSRVRSRKAGPSSPTFWPLPPW